MIKAAVVGATGYVGSELLRLLLAHSGVEITSITSQTYKGKKYGDIFQNYSHLENLFCEEQNIVEISKQCDIMFLALPHGVASKLITEDILDNIRVIDLGADFRLKDVNIYEKWYDTEHFAKKILEEAVYGLCEINREQIKTSGLIANPGCYTTCSILSLYPLLKEGVVDEKSIIIDAKSGVSGAGRNADVHFNETNETLKAYKVASHRHTPEIEEQLSYAFGSNITLTFTPHLIPMNRGIIATCYANLKQPLKRDDISNIYKKYYGNEYFIRLCKQGVLPESKWVKGSNFCDIGFVIDERTNRIVIVGAIDNLVKGAAGQAVQNMNIMFGLDEKEGIGYVPMFPI